MKNNVNDFNNLLELVHHTLEKHRLLQGLSQHEMAETLGLVNKSSYSRRETGKIPLTCSDIDTICQTLGIRYEEILNHDLLIELSNKKCPPRVKGTLHKHQKRDKTKEFLSKKEPGEDGFMISLVIFPVLLILILIYLFF